MPINCEIKLKNGLSIAATEDDGGRLQMRLSSSRLKGDERPPDCILHWGVRAANSTRWQLPPESFFPPGTKTAGAAALQSPFMSLVQGMSCVTLPLGDDVPFQSIEFVLFFPGERRWDNNNGKNYRIELNKRHDAMPTIPEFPCADGVIDKLNHTFEGGGHLHASVTNLEGGGFTIDIYTDLPSPVVLHWGISAARGGRWLEPPVAISASSGSQRSGSAVDSPFDFSRGYGHCHIEFPNELPPPFLTFVIYLPSTGQWLKSHGQNFYIPIAETSGQLSAQHLDEYVAEITGAEMSGNSWTLMHRFNLCYNLCERLSGDAEGFALLTVWLRYSAMRQLDWQRNYNTKPRELSHSEDRLTLKLAGIYIDSQQVRPFIPLMLMSIGPGGDGQRIRDEILQIMHRHRIKEVSGHFLEEWHQKLHNNTTADDVVICEAYLAFLYSNGNRDRFYEVLNRGGVTEERLRRFERPIRSHPDFVHHLKDGLIHDFENYLKTLKAVHSSTDLDRALTTSSHLLDDETRGALYFIGQNRDAKDTGRIKDLVATAVWIRGRLRRLLDSERDTHRVREMLFLDLSLIEFIRLLVERCERLDISTLVELVTLGAENISIPEGQSQTDEEIHICTGHLRTLPPRDANDWVLHVIGISERLERILGTAVEWYYQTFQEKAETLGRAFTAAPWTVNLFTEELLRGQPPFVLSLLLRRLNQALRSEYKLGNWQVISPFVASGKVVPVDTLRRIQDERFDSSTVIIADKVAGDEEIPDSVTAVISADMTDIVSHVAVRARNARVLFATCYDSAVFDSLKVLAGRYVSLSITQAGDVAFNEIPPPNASTIEASKDIRYVLKPEPIEFTSFALPLSAFNRRVAGGKSNNLAALAGKLPNWMTLPPSVVIPFGAMEKVLGINTEIDAQYRRLSKDVTSESLPKLRELIEGLTIPDEFMSALEGVTSMAGVSYSASERHRAAKCIKKVWASLWNERAYLSRIKSFAGNPHEGVSMAVLVQETVRADYAFVIHTVNPVTLAKDEIFAEVVLGLGETLVGNHPGRALSFTCKKDGDIPRVASYPCKSFGLYAEGLIFRSDSNVEDLSGLAGAGLYDSILMKEPKRLMLDYSNNPLVRDDTFRNGLLSKIKEIAVAVETSFGSPQDIEGAYADAQYCVLQSRPQVGI